MQEEGGLRFFDALPGHLVVAVLAAIDDAPTAFDRLRSIARFGATSTRNRSLASAPQLWRRVDFTALSADCSAIRAAAAALARCPQLAACEDLRLQRLPNAILRRMLCAAPFVRALSLDFVPLSDECSACDVGESVAELRLLRKLRVCGAAAGECLAGLFARGWPPLLRKVRAESSAGDRLQRDFFGLRGLRLPQLTSLFVQEISPSSSSSAASNGVRLASVACACPALRSLVFVTPFRADGVRSVWRGCPCVERLTLMADGGCPDAADVARAPCAGCLRRFSFFGPSVADDGLSLALGRACHALTEVHLSGDCLGGDGLRALARLPLLEVVFLAFPRIRELSAARADRAAGLLALGCAEGRAPFRRLTLSGYDGDLAPFLAAPRCACCLEELQLSWCGVSEVVGAAVVGAAGRTLRALGVENEGLDGDFLRTVAAGCVRLVELKVATLNPYSADRWLARVNGAAAAADGLRQRLLVFEIAAPAMTEDLLSDMLPLLPHVVQLFIRCKHGASDSHLRRIFDACPRLTMLAYDFHQLRPASLPPNIRFLDLAG